MELSELIGEVAEDNPDQVLLLLETYVGTAAAAAVLDDLKGVSSVESAVILAVFYGDRVSLNL